MRGESWFDAKSGVFSKTIKDTGYELHHAHRENKRGGGVVIMYKKHVCAKNGEASSSQYLSFEYAYVTFTLKSKRRIVLVCVYRNQEISFAIFHDEFSSFMEKIYKKGDAAVLVGDFNVWVDVEDNAEANKLLTLMNAYGLNQIVQEPTHRSGHTLDQIYVNDMQVTIEHQVINETMGLTTDHFPILVGIPSANKQQKTHTITYRKMKDVDFNAFNKMICRNRTSCLRIRRSRTLKNVTLNFINFQVLL